MVDWGYFNKYLNINEKYLPHYGEGETMATQIVTAVTKLVYKWYNDGDVFDNTHISLGWRNDLSSYANWLWKHTPADSILGRVYGAYNDDKYEAILKDLADEMLDADFLAGMDKLEKVGSIYDCEGPFKFLDYNDEEDYYEDEDEEDEDYYDEEEDY